MGPVVVRSHRLGGGRFLAWFIVLVAVAAGVQSLVAGDGAQKLVGAFAATSVTALCVLLGMRPRVLELPLELEVRNPLRTAHLPWPAITEIDAVDVVRVTAGELVVRCFALPRRDRRPIVSGMASFFGGRPLPDNEPMRTAVTTGDVVESLRRRAGSLGAGSSTAGEGATYDYAPWGVALLVVCVVSAGACAVLAFAA